ncbi:hypothetical protein C486_10749 [Natrinema gari JCM 14663]|uniref:Uncharacterized protein n=1 Tax=Natrinema gari JCM 14663 TaxID=1230459 RepID=L9Z2T6_9EURY|nr:hypothetical protein C486_10749 [Natrinema gari JCM 14663]
MSTNRHARPDRSPITVVARRKPTVKNVEPTMELSIPSNPSKDRMRGDRLDNRNCGGPDFVVF